MENLIGPAGTLAALLFAAIPPVIAFVRHARLRLVVTAVSLIALAAVPHVLFKIAIWLICLMIAVMSKKAAGTAVPNGADGRKLSRRISQKIVPDDHME